MREHLAIAAVTGSLPEGWRIIEFRRLARERGLRNADLAEQALSLSSTGSLYERTEETDRQFASEQSARNGWVVRPGDLVVNPMWLFGGAIGVSDCSGAVSPDYRVYQLSDAVHPRFLHHLLRARPYRDQYRLYMRAETTFDRRVTKDDFHEMPLIVPPLATQVRLAHLLDSEAQRIEKAIAQREEQARLLDERMAVQVAGMIRSAIGDERPVSTLGTYINGYPFKPDDFTDEGLPVIRIRQLTDPAAPVDLYNGSVPERSKLENGDLVFSWSGSLEARVWHRGSAILNQHLFRVIPGLGIDRDWLRWALHVARDDFAELMHGSTMTHITKPMMRAVRVRVPELRSQVAIGRTANLVAEQTNELKSLVSQEVDLLHSRQVRLAEAAVTGHPVTATIAS